ncbi:H-NS family nucleoid-associated regulatory protein [Aquabacterium sp.]|uniref:H-NS histone family protein n=1 Tax=Aquabacterium sp. TaxID=1872578 RepID=UPI003784DA85
MAKSLAQIQKQIEALQREADAIKASEKSGVVARIKEAITHYGITAAELGLGKGGVRGPRGPYKKRAKSGAPAAKKAGKKPNGVVKYRDDAGNTWSGRGPKPRWFKAALEAGKKPEDLQA